jgi:hypothetical protein
MDSSVAYKTKGKLADMLQEASPCHQRRALTVSFVDFAWSLTWSLLPGVLAPEAAGEHRILRGLLNHICNGSAKMASKTLVSQRRICQSNTPAAGSPSQILRLAGLKNSRLPHHIAQQNTNHFTHLYVMSMSKP